MYLYVIVLALDKKNLQALCKTINSGLAVIEICRMGKFVRLAFDTVLKSLK